LKKKSKPEVSSGVDLSDFMKFFTFVDQSMMEQFDIKSVDLQLEQV